MGRVYLAEDPVIGRQVAVKVVQLHADLDTRELAEIQGRFEREFRAAGTLSHPHIVTVFDVGQDGESAYIAMEYVRGESLEKVLESEDHSLTFGEIADLTFQLGSALDYAHERDIVHRDIKPANVLINWDGQAKITDFGIVKMTSSTMTRTGTIIGTPAYMSPEQVVGKEVSGASDQFSLAVILYQMLTGERPFGAENPTSILYKIVHQDPLPPQEVNRDLPTPVNQVLLKALAKDPAERYPTCRALAVALREALGAAVPDGDMTLGPADFEALPKAAKEGGLGWLWAALLALVVVGGAAWFLADELGIFHGGGGRDGAPLPVEETLDLAVLVAPEGAPGVEIWVEGVDTELRTPETVQLHGTRGSNQRLELRRGGEVLASTALLLDESTPRQWAPEIIVPRGGSATSPAPGPPPTDPQSTAPASTTVEAQPVRVVSTPSGARVLLDGQAVGTTPADLAITPGQSYRLRVELDGYKAQGMALAWDDLSANQRQSGELSFRLEAAIPPGFLVLNAGYPVTVTVAGRRQGPDPQLRLPLPPGEYDVTLSAPEVFLQQTRRVSVASESEVPLSLPAAIATTVTAVPGNCRVSIDGRFVDFTPLIDVPVVAGNHTFLFEWPTLGQSVTVEQAISPQNSRVTPRPPGGATGGTP
jgi:hypothetical protein